MTDRELLDLAAKAAGAQLWSKKTWPGICLSDDADCLPFEVYGNGGFRKSWNPLDDDGDALRLAGFLGLTLRLNQFEEWTQVFIGDCFSRTAESISVHACRKHDTCAATRRAIVRAAASIQQATETS